jgi:hypothetical protein
MEVTDPHVIRMVKGYDTLKTKISKLTDENVRLKQQLAEAKACQTRVRRVPRKTTSKPQELVTPDDATQPTA